MTLIHLTLARSGVGSASESLPMFLSRIRNEVTKTSVPKLEEWYKIRLTIIMMAVMAVMAAEAMGVPVRVVVRLVWVKIWK